MARTNFSVARELHLGAREGRMVDASAVTDSLNALPGFRSSAAFFTFLRANLVLPPPTSTSAMSSNTSTPLLNPSSSSALPPPSPSPLSSSTTLDPSTPANPLDGVPELTTTTLTTDADKLDALKLITDSIAQQRQTASRALIFSFPFAAAWTAVVGITYKLQYKQRDDVGIWFTTLMGLTMAMLIAVRWATSGYLAQAEEMKWEWLVGEDGEEDVVIGSRFGEEMIGALVLRLERTGGGAAAGGVGASAKKKGSKASFKGGKGVIKGWTTKLRYRHKGVGTGLLEEAIRVTREKCGSGAEVGFSAEHANSKMLLPELFNRPFRRGEGRAIKLLQSVDDGGKKKR